MNVGSTEVVVFPSGPAGGILIFGWNKGWEGRTEEQEGGREAGRPWSVPGGAYSAAVDCWK